MRTSVAERIPADRSRRRVVARAGIRLAAVGAVAAAACYVVLEVVQKPPLHGFFDLQVYRGAVLWWLQGEPLYSFELEPGPKGFTYPPFAAAVLVPLTWLPAGPTPTGSWPRACPPPPRCSCHCSKKLRPHT